MKKGKLLASIVSLCFALAVLTFGVFAANQVNYSISGNISYTVSDAYVEVTTTVYKKTTAVNGQSALDTLGQGAISSTTGLTAVAGKTHTYNSCTPTTEPAFTFGELAFATSSDPNPAYAYVFVINVKNLSSNVNAWAVVLDEVSPLNTITYTNDSQSVIGLYTQNETVDNKNIVVAIAVEDWTQNVANVLNNFSINLKVGIGTMPDVNELRAQNCVSTKLANAFTYDSTAGAYSVKLDSTQSGKNGWLYIPSTYDDGANGSASVTKVEAAVISNNENYDYERIIIPNSVTEIAQQALAGCGKIKSLTIPFAGQTASTSSERSKPGALGWLFKESSTVSDGYVVVTVTDGVYLYSLVPESLRSLKITSGTKTGSYALRGYNMLTSLELPSTLTTIYSFSGCSKLNSLKIDPENTTYTSRAVANDASTECNAIIKKSDNTLVQGCNSTVIPSTVTQIGSNAFNGSTGLTSVQLPNILTSIGNGAFNGCSSLSSIGTIPSGITQIGDDTFKGCGLTSLHIPDSITSIGSYAVSDCKSLTSLTFGENINLTSTGFYAFSGCSSLTSIELPNSVRNIDSSFNSCKNLSYVKLPDGLTTLKGFSNCSSLRSLVIPSTVTTLGGLSQTGFTKFVIPSGVTTLSSSAFQRCADLTEVYIPISVTSIGSYVFYECTNLLTINYAGTTSQWASVSKTSMWDYQVAATVVHCSDGDVAI